LVDDRASAAFGAAASEVTVLEAGSWRTSAQPARVDVKSATARSKVLQRVVAFMMDSSGSKDVMKAFDGGSLRLGHTWLSDLDQLQRRQCGAVLRD
jgi:hypothetical protein